MITMPSLIDSSFFPFGQNFASLGGERQGEQPYSLTWATYIHERDAPLDIDLDAVIARQALSTKRTQVERDGDARPYGKAIQLHHLRKGIAGDWRNYFDRACIDLAHTHWQPYLLQFNYERDDDWTTIEL